ncbi:MAG: phospho-N-acetylmuramoyl-pentapeptide-transferase [Deltaproteobacteria bacterium]|nr:phospho-N-acetylmuramoyl-pentapeptide-transferase [Deltaproteobacteria bacterium]
MMFYYLYLQNKDEMIFNIFKYITFRTFAAVVTAFFLYIVLGKPFIHYLKNRSIGQFIRGEGPESHSKKQGTPTMGGLLIIFCVLISILLWGNLTNAYLWIVVFVLLAYGAIGFYDDFQKLIKKQNLGLQARVKFPLQVLVCMAVGFVLIHYLDFNTKLIFPFFKNFTPDLGWYYLIMIFFVIVGSSNAVNLTDGLDGLVAVPNIMAFSTYGLLSYIIGHRVIANYLDVAFVPGTGELLVLCGAVVGAIIGFLWFNSYPAEIFMGDTGSLSLGAALGTVAILAKSELLLILIGGIFVLETLSVMTQVISFKLTGKRIFRMAPLHHHFELKGWAEPKVIVRFWIISFMLCMLSLATLKIR